MNRGSGNKHGNGKNLMINLDDVPLEKQKSYIAATPSRATLNISKQRTSDYFNNIDQSKAR